MVATSEQPFCGSHLLLAILRTFLLFDEIKNHKQVSQENSLSYDCPIAQHMIYLPHVEWKL